MADMKRAEQIKNRIGIEQVLQDLGYPVHAGMDREQQFPCDLHGDGNDGKFSARVYPDSGSWYCFACGKARDAIETYRDKFGLGFGKACYTLEAKYGLPHLFSSKSSNEPVEIDRSEESFKIISRRCEKLMRSVQRILPMKESLAWWETLDCVMYYVQKGLWSYEKGYSSIERIMKKVKGEEDAKQGS